MQILHRYCLILALCTTGCIINTPSFAASTLPEKTTFAYRVSFLSPGVPTLAQTLKKNSHLLKLISQPPKNKLMLTLLIREDLALGKQILLSEGYYDGTVLRTVNWNQDPISIELKFNPGNQYVIGSTHITYSMVSQNTSLPTSLESFGLMPGSPATASTIIMAEEDIITFLTNNGYPFARLIQTKHTINRTIQTIDVQLNIEEDTIMHMGHLEPQEKMSISTEFLEKVITWKPGQLWSNAALLSYEKTLQQTGIFNFIKLKPGTIKDEKGNTPILLFIEEGPPRTISGGVQYSSSKGPGVRGTWEHKNILGHGENLRLTAPISQKDQQFLATFYKPAFILRNQALTSSMQIHNELAEGYHQQLSSLSTGIERKLNAHWLAVSKVSCDLGFMDDISLPRSSFIFFGLPLGIKMDSTDNPLNPVQGIKLSLETSPYIGNYFKNKRTLRNSASISTYLNITTEDTIVLAGKVTCESLLAKDVEEFPAFLRCYAGGGGSVRGYGYQSLGAKNKFGTPTGGLSSTTFNFELRLKITPTIGIVPFIDAGNAYASQFPQIKPLYWGLGLGFRYYSSISPIRIDFATPLTDKKNHAKLQIYINLGQAF